MRLYYTGVNKEGLSQLNADLSLGKYISGTLIPNGQLNNLFDNVDFSKKVQTKAIALYNEENRSIPSLYLYFDVANIQVDALFEIAIVALAEDDCGKFMEVIQNSSLLPYSATFNNVTGIDNVIELNNIPANQYYGLWIKRTILDKDIDCDVLYELHKNNRELEEEVITFHMKQSLI